MPAAWERIDRNVVLARPNTTVRELLERARSQPGRIYTWVVVSLPGGVYAVTRMNEIAYRAQELGAGILDWTMQELPGPLRAGGVAQASDDLDAAEAQALSSPGKRIPVLEGEEVLGVLNLGPQRPPLPDLDPWRLEGITPYPWPYDTLRLYQEIALLDPWSDVSELLRALEDAQRYRQGWFYLIVHEVASFYWVMAVDQALAEALRIHRANGFHLLIRNLPLPNPVPAVEEGSVAWEIVREHVLAMPARCLPITRRGRVIGVLAEPPPRLGTLNQWVRALDGEPAPWSGDYEESLGPPPTAPTEWPREPIWEPLPYPSEPPPPTPEPPRPRPRRGFRPEPEAEPPPEPVGEPLPWPEEPYEPVYEPEAVPTEELVGWEEEELAEMEIEAEAEAVEETWADMEPVEEEGAVTGMVLETLDEPGSMEEPPPPRFLNAGFFADDKKTMQPPDQPLALDGGPYCLGVNVGKYWGIGKELGPEYDVGGIVSEHLEELEEGEALDLIVTVRPRAVKQNLVKVDRPRDSLELPKSKDGPKVFFDLAFENPGLHALNVDLWYQGHLLQSMRVEFWVVEHAGDAMPAEQIPQDRHLTYSRAGTLSKASLAVLEKRPSTMTILVDRDEQIDLWFYDVEGKPVGTEQSHLSDAVLRDLLERMRAALEEAARPYQGQIGGDREMLRTSLWRLASIGNEFYRALLPKIHDPGAPGPADDLTKLPLTHGQVIQVDALSMLPGVPWELLYQRPIESFDEGEPDLVRLCPDFETHSPVACPHDDSEVVCPHNFWGYRYIIEQLPNWVPPKQPPPLADLPLVVRNRQPLRFVPVVYDWPNLDNHLDELRALAKEKDLHVEQKIETKARLKAELVDRLEPADILYFYVHGGFDQQGPMVELGPLHAKSRFRASDLAAWKDRIDLSLRQPLVVFNACETAAFLPEHHESLPKGFADRGASGVIGTQVKVYESFAAHFIRLFFQKFLAQKTVGQALFEARWELLFDRADPDPRGLVYSLFSAADVELARPVIQPE